MAKPFDDGQKAFLEDLTTSVFLGIEIGWLFDTDSRWQKQMKEIKTTALACAVMGFLGLISGVVSAFFQPQSALQNIVWYTSIGVFIGIMGAPTLSPEDFRYPTTQATLSGALAGLLVALFGSEGITAIAIGTSVGGVVGFLSPVWLQYFTF